MLSLIQDKGGGHVQTQQQPHPSHPRQNVERSNLDLGSFLQQKVEREENVLRSNDPFAYYNGRKNEGAINKIICILYEAKYNKFKRCICFCVCVVKKLKTF